ncbi:MAG: PilT/PilU family type 4a pilus ATPase [Proteobacteria bacterium]|nr:PilT/PilU family type 4a pilus ATPase [Pseudomonadota bacterium]MBU1611269.1 PilT/PilU family type 4a pilus ATPase [Pseudomonadota bacterium]
MQTEKFDAIINAVLEKHPDLSDIVMTPGKGVQAEVHGELVTVKLGPSLERLTPILTSAMSTALISDSKVHQRQLAGQGSCDLSYGLAGKGRFRVNIFKQRGNLSIVMRKLPTSIPTAKELGLPPVFSDIAKEKYGMVLVTGGTGTGKSNSLAALIDRINETRAVHILTLEDPVEFTHRHKKGVVNQREQHADFDSFASGLRAALRQAPKVIMVGEIRDRETMAIALQAAGTGHLVVSTIHANDTGSTINRVLGLFDSAEQRVVRMQLAESLKYVVSQRLLPGKEGGRVAAFEVMRNTLRIRELMLGGEDGDKTFYGIIADGQPYGMQTFDQHLFALFEAGSITEETAMLAASDRSKLGMMIDNIKMKRGESISQLKVGELEEDINLELA